MGCLFGARLSPHAQVTLIGHWPEQVHALSAGPLRLIDCDGQERLIPLRITDDPAEPVDVALIVTKAARTEQAAQAAARVLAPDGIAITLQNGLGHADMLASILGPERVTAGVTTLGASTGGQPGLLRCGGTGITHLATRPAVDARVRAVANLFAQAGLVVEVVDNIAALVWGKLAINAAINPLTALLRVPNGALLDSPWARRLMADAAQEVAAVAAEQGIALPFDDAAAQVETVARLTAANTSSMYYDVQRGVPTEIDAINGAIVQIGLAVGIATPVNRTLHALIKAVEETSRDHL